MELTEIHYELNTKLLDDIIVKLERAKGKCERRKSARQRFPVKQMVAPFYRKMPKAEQFVPVSCYDLSTSGIAFYWPRVPDFSKVIIGLGRGGRPTYVAARVVRHVECRTKGRVLVGCEFVDKVGLS